MQGFLVVAIWNLIPPNGCAPRLSPLANQQVAILERKGLARSFIEIHFEKVTQVEPKPLHICVTKILTSVLTGLLLLVEHLP